MNQTNENRVMNNEIKTNDDDLFIFSLDYSFIIDPKLIGVSSIYESNGKSWNKFVEGGRVYQMMDNLVPLQRLIEGINRESTNKNNFITFIKPELSNPVIIISIHGSIDFITESRLKILSEYNTITSKSINITNTNFQKILPHINNIIHSYNIEVIINHNQKIATKTQDGSDEIYLHLLGDSNSITLAETSIKVIIDAIFNNFVIDSVNINISLIPLIGGLNLINFNQISKQTNSNIYIPNLVLKPSANSAENINSLIFLTAKNIENILLTKQLLNNLVHLNQSFYHKTIDINQIKFDLILSQENEELLNIMFEFGTFLKVDSAKNSITVQGSCEDSVNSTIDKLNLLFANYYTINVLSNLQHKSCNPQMLYQLLYGKTVTIKSNNYGIEINGSLKDIKSLIPLLSNFKNTYTSINLRLELSNSQQDFISGKKNGKISKILNQLNSLPTIRFKNYNDYNFFIDFEISANMDISYMTKGLDLLELELPTEISFNVPEVFHKSIIGNGGSIIQLIMKKYNVFIKFSSYVNNNSDNCKTGESKLKHSYSFKRFNNVLIRCPRKNSANIHLVKYEIDQLVSQCCQLTTSPNYNTGYSKLMKSDYLLLINNNKLRSIQQLEIDYNCFINFPTCLDDFKGKPFVMMVIKGNESKIDSCIENLSSLILKKYEFKLTYNLEKFQSIINDSNQDFETNIIIPFKLKLGIELSILDHEDHHSIIVSYNTDENLALAIKNLTIYLRERGFLITDKNFFNENDNDVKKEKLPLTPITNRVNSAKNQKLNTPKLGAPRLSTKLSIPSVNQNNSNAIW